MAFVVARWSRLLAISFETTLRIHEMIILLHLYHITVIESIVDRSSKLPSTKHNLSFAFKAMVMD